MVHFEIEGAPEHASVGDVIYLSLFENLGHVRIIQVVWNAPETSRILECKTETALLIDYLVSKGEPINPDFFMLPKAKWE